MAGAPVDNGADATQTAQIPQAPVPDLPPLPKGATPPAAVIGVLVRFGLRRYLASPFYEEPIETTLITNPAEVS